MTVRPDEGGDSAQEGNRAPRDRRKKGTPPGGAESCRKARTVPTSLRIQVEGTKKTEPRAGRNHSPKDWNEQEKKKKGQPQIHGKSTKVKAEPEKRPYRKARRENHTIRGSQKEVEKQGTIVGTLSQQQR